MGADDRRQQQAQPGAGGDIRQFCARELGQQLDQREYLRQRTWQRISPAARWLLDVE